MNYQMIVLAWAKAWCSLSCVVSIRAKFLAACHRLLDFRFQTAVQLGATVSKGSVDTGLWICAVAAQEEMTPSASDCVAVAVEERVPSPSIGLDQVKEVSQRAKKPSSFQARQSKIGALRTGWVLMPA
jgi:hypothetical protein